MYYPIQVGTGMYTPEKYFTTPGPGTPDNSMYQETFPGNPMKSRMNILIFHLWRAHFICKNILEFSDFLIDRGNKFESVLRYWIERISNLDMEDSVVRTIKQLELDLKHRF